MNTPRTPLHASQPVRSCRFAIGLAVLLLCQGAPVRAADTCLQQSFGVGLSLDSTRALTLEWQRRLGQERRFSDRVVDSMGRHGHVLTGQVPFAFTDSRIEIDSIGPDSSSVTSILWTRLNSQGAQIVLPPLQGTYQQALHQPLEGGRPLPRKSLGIYLGLSLLNNGLGGLYLKQNNFTYRPHSLLVAANGLGEAATVSLIFSKNHPTRVLGYWCFAFYKAFALLPIPALNIHNRFSETGYQFAF